jgi:hypothetical protein
MNDVHATVKAPWWISAALSCLLMACGGGEFYRSVEQNMAQGKYGQAIEEIRANRKWFGDRNALLYNLDLGLLFHYAGEPDSSTVYFFEAERQIEELYTKSVSTQVASFLLNDNVIPYEGEDFEKVLVNLFLALNYAEKGETDEALVEARKVDLKLREYAREYEGKNTYQEDAFIRMIAGMLYESGGEINDAFISYRNAYETYGVYETNYGTRAPSFLLDDLVRTASKLSFSEEVEKYRALGGREYDRSTDGTGSVVVVVYAGNGPIKEEIRPSVSVPDSSGILHTFQVALPKFGPRMIAPRAYDVVLTDGRDSIMSRAELAEDITAIASKALDERVAMIYLKSGGRALLKFLAAEKMKSELKKDDKSTAKNFLGSLAIDLVMGATEQADLRTWRTLPAQIQLARLNLAPGYYTLRALSSDRHFAVRDVQVEVRKGRTAFVVVEDVR